MSLKTDSLASLKIGVPPLPAPFEKSAALLVHLLNQERLNSEHRIMLAASPVYRLLLVAGGSVRIHTDGKCLQVEAGMAMLLPADAFAELELNRHEDEHLPVCFRFDFTAADLSEPKPLRSFGLLPGFPDGFAEASAQVLELAEELHSLRFARTASVRNRRQPLFTRIMTLLAGNEESAPIPINAARAVADSLSGLEHRLAEDWTVARLAEASGLTSRQYASVFRSITGLSPLEYLNELRIEHAGRLLRRGDGPLREVASRTGFRDEYYFSRRFRAATGSSPGRYARQSGGTIAVRDSLHRRVFVPAEPKRILYLGESVGDLLALGISPIGGRSAPSRLGFCGEQLDRFTELASDSDMRGASAVRPDLIICTRMDEEYCRRWSKVAPVLAHNSWGALDERMLLLGNWFGREKESERWLEHYFEQERGMWKGLGHGVKRETASVFTFERNRLFVMGRVGLSALLYHPDGFRPAESLLDSLRRGEGYVEISPEKAVHYAADRIFLLLPPTAEERKLTGEFMRGPYWEQLQESALRGVHVIESAQWNFIDAYSRSRLLTALPGLLDGKR
ncbi:helix-turn-helix domain-containing protein [Saccharibacillus sacchari]|uniref:helix-turn-helix domain-containing protein n=1 Tax=Saccharibacillus sacchari TaxID=456493 RepID=UPI0004BA5782|nr:helix-turn-helix domain-containing protein [Saccharibacillus sacchari]